MYRRSCDARAEVEIMLRTERVRRGPRTPLRAAPAANVTALRCFLLAIRNHQHCQHPNDNE
jgi:hypothetical protein